MIANLIAGYTWQIATGAALLVGVATWDGRRKADWYHRGQERARVEQRQGTDAAIKLGTAGADLSRTGGVRRKLPVDPSTRD